MQYVIFGGLSNLSNFIGCPWGLAPVTPLLLRLQEELYGTALPARYRVSVRRPTTALASESSLPPYVDRSLSAHSLACTLGPRAQ
jgi:hypothetical protein